MDDLILISDQRPTRADAVRNHDQILDVARRLFEDQGVDEVTMSAIAQEAGVGKGTLYRHFPDKLSLIHSLLDTEQRELQERTLEHLRQGDTPDNNLHWFISTVLDFVWRKLDMFRNDGLWQPLAHPAHYWWRQTMRGLIHQANPTVDADYAADALYVMLNPPVIYFQKTARGMSTTEIIFALCQMARKLTTA